MLTTQDKEEKRILRAKLSKLGISSSPNASLDTLRAKLAEVQEEHPEPEVVDKSTVKSTAQLLADARKDALKLIRCRIKNLNPAKRDLNGEIFTVANEVLGKISKYVPYDEAGEAYHIPNCIYKVLKAKKFLEVRTVKDPDTKATRVVQSWVPEFNIEILPPLTTEELKDLAIKQQAQNKFEE